MRYYTKQVVKDALDHMRNKMTNVNNRIALAEKQLKLDRAEQQELAQAIAELTTSLEDLEGPDVRLTV